MFNINMNIRHLILKVLNFHLYAQTKMARNGGFSTTPFVFSEGNYLQPADRYTSQLQSSTWSGVSYCFPKCVPTGMSHSVSGSRCFVCQLLYADNGGTTNCHVQEVCQKRGQKYQVLGSMWFFWIAALKTLPKKTGLVNVFSVCEVENHDVNRYPLVMTNIAIENGHLVREFSH